MPSTILVVEDDQVIRDTLRLSLTAAGHLVTTAATASAALRAVAEHPDLVLLDLGLPDADGFTTCRRLRALSPEAVIIVLTARHDELDVVAGLESGADDYLLKPFKLLELLARIRAHLRRTQGPEGAVDVLQVGELRIDPRARTATIGTSVLPLRNREFDLLARLAREPETAVSRERLMADVWDEHWEGSTKTLDVHVLSLRRKLADAAAHADGIPPLIVTLRGHGYRLDPPARA